MFKVNEIILYGIEGVCKVKEITSRKFGGQVDDYYILEPIYSNNSTLYVPINNKNLTSRMRHVLSTDKVHHLIKDTIDMGDIWIDNDKLRQSQYKEIISRGDYLEIMNVIKTLHSHKKYKIAEGKKFHKADQDLLSSAQNILYNEFAHVLEIEPNEVLDYIIDELESYEKEIN